jgi:molybdenum cofactor synthesis domain-containing protein
MNVRCAVLTISDSSHAGTREDKSGPAVATRLEELGWSVLHRGVIPDERARIAESLAALASSGEYDVVFTSGGTGPALRDVTPEATRDVIEREIPGLGELMRLEGLKSTRRAVLSRSTAGIRGTTLIVNLPGSPKGALESLNAVADLVPHVVELLRGHTEHAEEAKRG